MSDMDTRCAATFRPALNFNGRRGDGQLEILLLHYTGMETGHAAEDWLCAEESGVSCHYLIHCDGRIVQMVPEALRAWHAGQGSWEGREDINSRSIGIEIVNRGHDHGYDLFPTLQVAAVTELCLDILTRNPSIKPSHVLAHSDIAPTRKRDPGELFPWEQLAGAGVGLWHGLDLNDGNGITPLREGEEIARWQLLMRTYGYHLGESGFCDEETLAATLAFHRHFLPHHLRQEPCRHSMNALEALLHHKVVSL